VDKTLIRVNGHPLFIDERSALIMQGPLLHHAVADGAVQRHAVAVGGPVLRHVVAGEKHGEYAQGRHALVGGEVVAHWPVRVNFDWDARQGLNVGAAHWHFRLRDESWKNQRHLLNLGNIKPFTKFTIVTWTWEAYNARNALVLGRPAMNGPLLVPSDYAWHKLLRCALAMGEVQPLRVLQDNGYGYARCAVQLGKPQAVRTAKDRMGWQDTRLRHALRLGQPGLPVVALEVENWVWNRRALTIGPLRGARRLIEDFPHVFRRGLRVPLFLPAPTQRLTEKSNAYLRCALLFGQPNTLTQRILKQAHNADSALAISPLSLPSIPKVLAEKGYTDARRALYFGKPDVPVKQILKQAHNADSALAISPLSLPNVPLVLHQLKTGSALRIVPPLGLKMLVTKGPPSLRRALQWGFNLSEAALLQQATVTLDKGYPHYFNRALLMGAPKMEGQLGMPSGFVQDFQNKKWINHASERRALIFGVPAKPDVAPPVLQGQILYVPFHGLPMMPWGATVVSGLLRTQQIVDPANGKPTGAGQWEILEGAWTHDGFGDAVFGSGALQVELVNDDGSSSGSFTGNGVWMPHVPAQKRSFFHAKLQQEVEVETIYTGGDWGGYGTWSISSSGALSWTFHINKGSGARIYKITKIGSSPANIVAGEGYYADNALASGIPTGEWGDGDYGNIWWNIEATCDSNNAALTANPCPIWDFSSLDFLSLSHEDLDDLLGDAQGFAGKQKKPKDDGDDKSSGGGSGAPDGGAGNPPSSPPDENGEGGSSSGNVGDDEIVFSGGAQLVGPVPAIVLPIDAAPPRRLGFLKVVAPTVMLHAGAHAKGGAQASGSSWALLRDAARASGKLQAIADVQWQDCVTAKADVLAGGGTVRWQVRARAMDEVAAFAVTADALHARGRVADAALPLAVGLLHAKARVQDGPITATVAAVSAYARALDGWRVFANTPDVRLSAKAKAKGLIAPWSQAQAAIGELAHAKGVLYAPDANGSCWVMTLGSAAVYFWRNWQFTHMRQVGDRVFAASAEGLALIGADDDAKRPIDACVQFGFSELGGFGEHGDALQNVFKKRVPYLVFGYCANGPLKVSCETYGQNWPVFQYAMPAAPAAQPVNGRVTVGKGLNSRYWRFGWENYNGCQFRVHGIIAEVLFSSRKL